MMLEPELNLIIRFLEEARTAQQEGNEDLTLIRLAQACWRLKVMHDCELERTIVND